MELITPEIQRISLSIGSLIALFWQKRFGVLPGGIIVPGLLGNLLLISPGWCLTLVAIAYLVQWIYQRWLARLEHQRRIPMYFLGALSLLVSAPLSATGIEIGLLPANTDSISGSLLPGIIAFSLHRQGRAQVGRSMLLATTITCLATISIATIGSLLFHIDFNQITQYYRHTNSIQLQAKSVQFLVALLVGMYIYNKAGLRAGGYVVAPMAAALMLEPISAVMFVIGCLSVEFWVRLVSSHSLIIGLSRYVVALLFSTAYVWTAEIVFIHAGVPFLPFQGSHILAIIAILSYANDAILNGRPRLAPWMILLISSAAVVLLVIHHLYALTS